MASSYSKCMNNSSEFPISNRWDFGADKEFADGLKELILSGKKIATTGLSRDNEKHSRVGEFDEILDSNGKPFCIIQYTKVEVKLFLEVDFEYVKLEGEDNKDIEDWRDEHRRFFLKYYSDFSDTDSVICAEFKVVKIFL